MPFFLFAKDINVCVLESFQHIDQLACIQNCDKCNQKRANWWKVALICIRMFLFVVRDFIFIFFCMLFNPSVAPASCSASIRHPAEPQPICPRLQSQLIAPFCLVKEIFFFQCLFLPFCSWADLIQFRLKIAKRVCFFCRIPFGSQHNLLQLQPSSWKMLCALLKKNLSVESVAAETVLCF